MKTAQPTTTQRHWCTTGHGYAHWHYVPSEWETMLKALGVSEKAVLDWQCAPVDKQRIKEWVRLRHKSLFVPERVLEHMGIPIWAE